MLLLLISDRIYQFKIHYVCQIGHFYLLSEYQFEIP